MLSGRSAVPVLPYGVVYLPNFLTVAESQRLVNETDKLTLSHPFLIQKTRNESGVAFSNMFMTHAGKWTYYGEGHKGEKNTFIERPDAISIPPVLFEYSKRAVEAALDKSPGAFNRPPFETLDGGKDDAFTALFNFYPRQWGALRMHRDIAEESSKPGTALYPVISFSVGDTGTFLITPDEVPDDRDREVKEAIQIELRSGDAILFGGKARTIRHGILAIDKTGVREQQGLKMVDGRLNITLRTL